MPKYQKCPECGSFDGVRKLMDVTQAWNGEEWEGSPDDDRFECFNCDADDIIPVGVDE